MEVAPHYTLFTLFTLFSLFSLFILFKLLYRVMLQNVRTLLEWDDELLSKKWDEVGE